MMGVWDELGAQCNERVEKAFQSVRHVASESRLLQSRMDVGDDRDLATATVVLNDVKDDIVVGPSSSAVAGTSGDGGRGDAILPDDHYEAMSQDV